MEISAGDTNVTTTPKPARWLASGGTCSELALGQEDRRWSRRTVLLLVALLLVILPGLFGVVVVRVAMSGRDVSQTLRLPVWVDSRLQRNEIAYPAHVTLARAFAFFRAPPAAEGLQWIKAAAHAGSDEQIRTVGAGLQSALARADAAQRTETVQQLCQAALRGSQPSHSMVVALSGLDCPIELGVWGHVPEGQPIYYQHNPPVGGPHYPVPYPTYGVIEDAVAPGYWNHNLEHGAVVLLYRCDRPCPELVGHLRALYVTLPPNQNSPTGGPRLLAVQYADLPSPLAMVSWAEAVLLDRFDASLIRSYYHKHVDRGPECRSLRCPE